MTKALVDIARQLNWKGCVHLNEYNLSGETLLCRAIHGHLQGNFSETLALELLELGADPNLPDLYIDGRTPLELTLPNKSLTDALIKAGADPIETPRIWKILFKHFRKLKRKKHIQEISSSLQFKREDYLSLIKLFLDKKVSLSSLDDAEAWSVMMDAKLAGLPISYWPRLEKGGLRILPNNAYAGESIFHHSVLFREPHVVNCLLKMGADIHQKDDFGQSALHKWTKTAESVAHEEDEAWHNASRIFKIFEKQSPNWNIQNDEGQTPFFSVRCETNYLERMLKQGANINQPDAIGQTPLLYFVRKSCLNSPFNDSKRLEFLIEKFNFFLQNGADITAQDHLGNTALHLVKVPAFVPLLLEAGADLNQPNNAGKRPFEMPVNQDNQAALVLIQKERFQRVYKQVDESKSRESTRL